MEAWHFLRAGGYTGEGNLLVVEGQTLRMPPPVQLCRKGFHFSIFALDALQYAPGPVVQRVWVPDDSILGADKGVAPERKCLWMYDATEVLHEFACMCAESALMIEGVEDDRAWNAIHVKREWLAGRASNDDLIKASWAARHAVKFSGWDAVGSASWLVAEDAAIDAARDAAWVVSMGLLRPDLRTKAWDEMNAVLEWMLLKNR